jgi:hypothetical protein
MSGFISDLDLMDSSEVYVFLMLPQKYSHLIKDIFGSTEELNQRYNEFSRPYLNRMNSIFDDYVPFAFPFKARYQREGVYIEKRTPMIEWLEKTFNVDLDDYLENLSERSHPSKCNLETITKDNVFNYLSVGFEHQSFVDQIFNNLRYEEDCVNFKYVDELFKKVNYCMITNILNGKELDLYIKNHSKIDLLKNIEEIELELLQARKEMGFEALQLHVLSYFIRRVNKIYRPSSVGNGIRSKKCIDMLSKVKKEVLESQCKEEEGDD